MKTFKEWASQSSEAGLFASIYQRFVDTVLEDIDFPDAPIKAQNRRYLRLNAGYAGCIELTLFDDLWTEYEKECLPKRCAKCRFCTNKKTNDYGSFSECLLQDDKKVNRNSVNNLVWSRDSDCPLVEIVTCKDCDNRCTGGLCTKHNITVTKEFYCADAERRE